MDDIAGRGAGAEQNNTRETMFVDDVGQDESGRERNTRTGAETSRQVAPGRFDMTGIAPTPRKGRP